jgi:hypothetical protein
MAKNPLSELWFHKESRTFYQVPTDLTFLPGDYPVQRFDGVEKKILEKSIAQYRVDEENVETLLKAHYETTKKAAAKAIGALTQFSALTNKAAHEDFEKMFSAEDPDSIIGKSQRWAKDFMANMQNEDATEEDQKESFKSAFGQVPEILDLFNEESLKKASENPDAWAKEINEKMFGKEDAERKEKDTKRRQNDINEQIRKNVEDAMKNPKKD